MKTSTSILIIGMGCCGLLLAGCAESPTVPQATRPALATPPPPKTCQTDFATGSHYQQHTICMTEDEERDSDNLQRQSLANQRARSAGTSGLPVSIVPGAPH